MLMVWSRVADVEANMKEKNKGSAVIEVCMIMPLLLGIIVLCIFLFIDSINDSVIRSDAYATLYTYNINADADEEREECIININNHLIGVFCLEDIDISEDDGEISLSVKSDYISGGNLHQYITEDKKYKTEYELCTKRLRRWQLYGDFVQ